MVGLIVLQGFKYLFATNSSKFEIEHLFGNAKLMATARSAAGILVIISARLAGTGRNEVTMRSALWIGAMQGLCLLFQGFSRSGATISIALRLVVERRRAEQFSFALAVILTPVVIVKEGFGPYAGGTNGAQNLLHTLGLRFFGMG